MDTSKVTLLRERLIVFKLVSVNTAQSLRAAADELDIVFNKVTKAKVAGYSTSIAGSVLSIVGFGLSFATFGASLGLCIAGGIIGGAGGITAAGASIGDNVNERKTIKYIKKMIEDYYIFRQETMQLCFETGTDFETQNNVKITKRQWAQFGFGIMQIGKEAGWSILGQTVKNALTYSDDAVSVFANNLFKVSKVFHIAGGVSVIALVPVDIYFLVRSAKDLHKENPHKLAEQLRQLADDVDMNSPTEENINNMLSDISYP